MPLQNLSEIRRPVIRNRGIPSTRDNELRERLSKIETPAQMGKKSFKITRKLIITLIVLLAVIILIYFASNIFKSSQHQVKSDWQAVFLSDGHVYFGKVVQENDKVVVLQNIYYLKESGALQQGENNLNKQTGDISLIKLGNEIHGPYDEMRLNRAHVLFIEDLKDDSKVVKAIKEHIGE